MTHGWKDDTDIFYNVQNAFNMQQASALSIHPYIIRDLSRIHRKYKTQISINCILP